MLRADRDVEPLNNRVTDAIARHRYWLFVLVALLYIGSFNGRWRLGLDTANYRGLALNIAAGKGYVFGDWAPKQIYPGFPYILAGIEYALGPAHRTPSLAEDQRLLGPSLATSASVLFVLACAAAALLLIYKLIRLHYPTWVATTVTCGVGTNSVFLQHSQELLTDVPFLLGVVGSLYGWEKLKRAGTPRERYRAAVVLIPGLTLAASLRPTFWILIVCWGAVCAWGLITGPRRFYAFCLLVLLGIWTSIHGIHPLSGGYEREAMDVIPNAPAHLGPRLYYILHDQLPTAVFGERLAPFSVVGSLLVLGSTLLLFRRHAMWVMMVFVTFAVTTLLSAAPRYYTMVLPVLMLGWVVMLCAAGRRLPRIWGEVLLAGGLALVTLNNLSASVHFFIEQHRGDHLAYYEHGEYVPMLQMCERIRLKVRPDQKVVGPSGSIMSVFSGVHVLTQREIIPRGDGPFVPGAVAETGIDYFVCPGVLYRSKEPVLARLMDRRLIMPVKVVSQVSPGMYLAIAKVIVPSTDWRKLPPDWKPPREIKPLKKKHPTTRPIRKKKAATRATTRSTTRRSARPATKPATMPFGLLPRLDHPYVFRATTTMLSPVLLCANGAQLSGVPVYGGSALILDTALATCGSGAAFEIVNFFIPK